jgi:hypothetical protein
LPGLFLGKSSLGEEQRYKNTSFVFSTITRIKFVKKKSSVFDTSVLISDDYELEI